MAFHVALILLRHKPTQYNIQAKVERERNNKLKFIVFIL